MKIICSKDELVMLVRNCMGKYSTCSGCPFTPVCAMGEDQSDEEIMSCIEDICEIEVGAGG